MEENPKLFFSDGGSEGKVLRVHYKGGAGGTRLGSLQIVGSINTSGEVQLDDGVKLGSDELQVIVDKCAQVRKMMKELLGTE